MVILVRFGDECVQMIGALALPAIHIPLVLIHTCMSLLFYVSFRSHMPLQRCEEKVFEVRWELLVMNLSEKHANK